jgi:type IV secretory pathway TraG/TraD family ATPase VirD4
MKNMELCGTINSKDGYVVFISTPFTPISYIHEPTAEIHPHGQDSRIRRYKWWGVFHEVEREWMSYAKFQK